MTSPLTGAHTTGDTDHIAVHDALDQAAVQTDVNAISFFTVGGARTLPTGPVVAAFDKGPDQVSNPGGNDIFFEEVTSNNDMWVHLASPGLYVCSLRARVAGLVAGDSIELQGWDVYGTGMAKADNTATTAIQELISVADNSGALWMPRLSVNSTQVAGSGTIGTSSSNSQYISSSSVAGAGLRLAAYEVNVKKLTGVPAASDPRPAAPGLSIALSSPSSNSLAYTITDTDAPPGGATAIYDVQLAPASGAGREGDFFGATAMSSGMNGLAPSTSYVVAVRRQYDSDGVFCAPVQSAAMSTTA